MMKCLKKSYFMEDFKANNSGSKVGYYKDNTLTKPTKILRRIQKTEHTSAYKENYGKNNKDNYEEYNYDSSYKINNESPDDDAGIVKTSIKDSISNILLTRKSLLIFITTLSVLLIIGIYSGYLTQYYPFTYFQFKYETQSEILAKQMFSIATYDLRLLAGSCDDNKYPYWNEEQLKENLRKYMNNVEQNLFESAFMELLYTLEKEKYTIRERGKTVYRSTEPIIPFKCIARDLFYSNLHYIIMLVIVIIIIFYLRYYFRRRKMEGEYYKEMRSRVFSSLSTKNEGEKWIPMLHMRENILHDLNIPKKFHKIWDKVEQSVENDARVRVTPKLVRGEQMVTWEYTA